MVGLLGYAAAGALAGAGEGIAKQAERNFAAMQEELRNKRQVARDEANRQFQTSEREATQEFRSGETAADRDWRSGEADEDRAFRSGEAAADRDFRRREGETDRQFRDRMAREDRDWRSGEADREAGRQTDRFQDSEGNWWVRSKAGAEAERVTGPDGAPIAGKGPTPVKEKDQSVNISRALKDATTKDLAGNEQVDYRRYAQRLTVYGVPMTPALQAEVEGGLRDQIQAEVQKEAVAGDDASWFSDGAYGSGATRQQRVKAEVDKRMAEERRRLGLEPSSGAATASASSEAGKPVKGSGTEEDPYTATTQEHVDWFKQQAKPGDVISINGTLYTKQ